MATAVKLATSAWILDVCSRQSGREKRKGVGMALLQE